MTLPLNSRQYCSVSEHPARKRTEFSAPGDVDRLGVELAKAAALIKDTMVILANGGSTFVRSFKDSYREHRQVERRRADGSS